MTKGSTTTTATTTTSTPARARAAAAAPLPRPAPPPPPPPPGCHSCPRWTSPATACPPTPLRGRPTTRWGRTRDARAALYKVFIGYWCGNMRIRELKAVGVREGHGSSEGLEAGGVLSLQHSARAPRTSGAPLPPATSAHLQSSCYTSWHKRPESGQPTVEAVSPACRCSGTDTHRCPHHPVEPIPACTSTSFPLSRPHPPLRCPRTASRPASSPPSPAARAPRAPPAWLRARRACSWTATAWTRCRRGRRRP